MGDRSKAQRILWLLHAAWPNWTPAPELAKISLQYAARVKELREAGWLIANRVEFHGRTKHGFYRLGITGAKTEPKNKTTDDPQPVASALPASGSGLLFSLPERIHPYPD